MTEPSTIDFSNLVTVRQRLHSLAEVAGEETETAGYIRQLLEETGPDELLTEVGGNGIIAGYHGEEKGETLMFRAELDALPIPETITPVYASENKGKSHKCGHDGHMAILIGLARKLQVERPKKGKVYLLFQPAEETGEGAEWVIRDPRFKKYKPDYVYALHNLPGYDENTVILRDDVFASASTGFIARLKGQTSHAGHPEDGNSPAPAFSSLIDGLNALPPRCAGLNDAALVTVIHARLGEVAFGTTPGEAEVMATLRAHSDDILEDMLQTAQMVAEGTAGAWGLELVTERTEHFKAVVNNTAANKLIRQSVEQNGLKELNIEEPFPWSEDFGRFTELYPGALVGLGAGIDHPQLHHRTYDFPDQLIEKGVTLFSGIVDNQLGSS